MSKKRSAWLWPTPCQSTLDPQYPTLPTASPNSAVLKGLRGSTWNCSGNIFSSVLRNCPVPKQCLEHHEVPRMEPGSHMPSACLGPFYYCSRKGLSSQLFIWLVINYTFVILYCRGEFRNSDMMLNRLEETSPRPGQCSENTFQSTLKAVL